MRSSLLAGKTEGLTALKKAYRENLKAARATTIIPEPGQNAGWHLHQLDHELRHALNLAASVILE